MRGKNRGPFADEETEHFLRLMARARLRPESALPPTPSMLKAYCEGGAGNFAPSACRIMDSGYICTGQNKKQKGEMPEISRFFGIIVYLYGRDHNPPHIHFTYGGHECAMSVPGRIVSGTAPAKVIARVSEWMDIHEGEILALWEKAQRGERLGRIEPLNS